MQQIELKIEELDYRSKEAYKTLRTNVEFSGDSIKVVAITSCTPNEGKSSIAYELACSFAQNGKKVLLVDADLRKSVLIRKHFKGKVRFGLVHYLVGKYSFDDVCCETNLKNMYGLDVAFDDSDVALVAGIGLDAKQFFVDIRYTTFRDNPTALYSRYNQTQSVRTTKDFTVQYSVGFFF